MWHVHTHIVFKGKLASVFCRLAFEVEATEEGDDKDEDFILASSASKVGARVLTTASRSDCCARDWTAREQDEEHQTELCQFAVCNVSLLKGKKNIFFIIL